MSAATRSGRSWARPWQRLPEGTLVPLVAVLASAVVLATGALSLDAAGELLGRTWSVLVFLLAAAVLASLAGVAGVFEVAAVWAAHHGGGRTWRLWLLVVGIATAATVALSLDTTAVLLTPVVLALARRARMHAGGRPQFIERGEILGRAGEIGVGVGGDDARAGVGRGDGGVVQRRDDQRRGAALRRQRA